MLRTVVLTAVAASALAAPAFAGGSGPAAQPPVITPPPAAGVEWGGFYGGVALEYGEGTIDPINNDFDIMNYGVFAGYRVDYGNWVFGTEFDAMSSDIEASGLSDGADAVYRATLEVGVEAGNALIYGTGGVFMLDLNEAGAGPFDDTDWGVVLGAGVDYKITDSVFVSAEVLYHQIDDFSGSGQDIDATTLGLGLGFRF